MTKIIEEVASGGALRKALADRGLSTGAFWNELQRTPQFQGDYERAQQARAELHAEEIIEISDTEQDAQRARNRIDARKWLASKLQPRKYGDKLDLNVTTTTDVRGALDAARSRAALASGLIQVPNEDPSNVIDVSPVDSTKQTETTATGSESVAKECGNEVAGENASENEAIDIFS